MTLSHGWPLNADAWDGQMLFLAQNGFRCIAHDRRGPGRSSQASEHNDMNGYADDLPALLEARSNRGAARPGSPQRCKKATAIPVSRDGIGLLSRAQSEQRVISCGRAPISCSC